MRTVIGVAALAAVYALLASAGLRWATVGAAVSPVWPASGVAIAVMLIGGKRYWPGVFIGSLIATSLVPEPHPLFTRLLISAGDSLAVVIAVGLMQSLKVDRQMSRVRDVLLLIGLGGFTSGLISGVVAISALVALQGVPTGDAGMALVRWVAGDAVGVVVLAPVILTWARRGAPRTLDWWGIFALLAALTLMVSWLVFVAPPPGVVLLPWHVVPFLVAAALILDARGATSVALIAAAMAIYGSLPGGGAFALLREGGVLTMQQYVVITSATTALVAVMVEALRRARTAVENEQAYLATAANEARLRLAQEAGHVGTWDWDVEGNTAVCSEALLEIFGWPLGTLGVSFAEWIERVHPEDRDRALAEVRAAGKGFTSYSSEYRILLPSGEVRHVDSRARLFYGPDGRTDRVIGVVVDVTDRKQAEERQRLLMREVDHRAKNALAVVQAVVRLTKAETQEAFAAAVEGRIQAIARAHNLLAASRWAGASLRKLVDEEIEPYQGTIDGGGLRVRAEGPDVTLEPDAAQPLALVLHELVTNAAKHGALSAPGGSVDIRWSLDAPTDRLRLSWIEKGGPKAEAPSRGGFGSTLISASVERQLHGTLQQTWKASGLRCDLEIPLMRSVRPDGDARPAEEGSARGAVLLVEDEVLIGLDMKQRLEALGWTVTGPVPTVDAALRAIDEARPAMAVLDVNLRGERTGPVAERLRSLGVPFAFSTGYGDFAEGAAEYEAPVLVKPVTTEELKAAFDGLDGQRPH